jgi:hypothetical protein
MRACLAGSSLAAPTLASLAKPITSKPAKRHPGSRTARHLSYSQPRREDGDPRLKGLGKQIADEFARVRDHYGESCKTYTAAFAKHMT